MSWTEPAERRREQARVTPRAEWSEAEFDAYAGARWNRLVRTAYLLTGDHHEAEDLVQSTLAKVFRRWPTIRQLDDPDAYLHRALINNNRSRHRRQRVLHLLTPDPPDRPAGPAAPGGFGPDDDGEHAALAQALAELPPRQRAVVVLRFWEDLSERQVAEVLGCTPGTVKSQASRALRKLRAHPALASRLAPPPEGADRP